MDQSIQNEIIKNENLYWQAIINNDVQSALSLTRFPCTISGPQGSRQVSKTEYQKLMEGNDGSRFKDVKIENARVELMNEDSAVIVYETNVNGMKMLDTSLWLKEHDKWICGYHSEFPVQ